MTSAREAAGSPPLPAAGEERRRGALDQLPPPANSNKPLTPFGIEDILSRPSGRRAPPGHGAPPARLPDKAAGPGAPRNGVCAPSSPLCALEELASKTFKGLELNVLQAAEGTGAPRGRAGGAGSGPGAGPAGEAARGRRGPGGSGAGACPAAGPGRARRGRRAADTVPRRAGPGPPPGSLLASRPARRGPAAPVSLVHVRTGRAGPRRRTEPGGRRRPGRARSVPAARTGRGVTAPRSRGPEGGRGRGRPGGAQRTPAVRTDRAAPRELRDGRGQSPVPGPQRPASAGARAPQNAAAGGRAGPRRLYREPHITSRVPGRAAASAPQRARDRSRRRPQP